MAGGIFSETSQGPKLGTVTPRPPAWASRWRHRALGRGKNWEPSVQNLSLSPLILTWSEPLEWFQGARWVFVFKVLWLHASGTRERGPWVAGISGLYDALSLNRGRLTSNLDAYRFGGHSLPFLTFWPLKGRAPRLFRPVEGVPLRLICRILLVQTLGSRVHETIRPNQLK